MMDDEGTRRGYGARGNTQSEMVHRFQPRTEDDYYGDDVYNSTMREALGYPQYGSSRNNPDAGGSGHRNGRDRDGI